MTTEFAQSLADIRLLQTARLLEWMIANNPLNLEALSVALGAVSDARHAIRPLVGESSV